MSYAGSNRRAVMTAGPLFNPEAPTGRLEKYPMKHDRCTARVVRYLLAGSLLAGVSPLLADPAAECRQEVQDYAIPPEQAADYIDGCILSRGGSLAPVASEEYAPVDDSGAVPPAETDPIIEAGQPDGELPGGINGSY